MDQQSTPFDNDAVWTLAGSNSDGIVYAVSIDPVLLDINLWAYAGAKDSWKLLATSDQASAPENHHCLMSAAYNEQLARVDVFLECHEASAFLFRFLTGPPARLECVVVAANNENIQFDGVNGPSMYYFGSNLIIAGAMRGTVDLRLFQVDLNYDGHALPNSFTLTQVWMGGSVSWVSCPRCVAIGDYFIISDRNLLHIFGPTRQWSAAVMIAIPWLSDPEDFVTLCAPPNSADRIWMLPSGTDIREFAVCDGRVKECRILRWASDEHICPFYPAPMNVAAASSTHLFWVQDEDDVVGYKLKSKMFEPPSLQYLCLSKLCSLVAAVKECETEEEARKLGISVLAWRRYCR